MFKILKFRSIITHIDDFPGSEGGGGGAEPLSPNQRSDPAHDLSNENPKSAR